MIEQNLVRLDLENLVNQVRLINSKYEMLFDNSGEKFNIFSIVKLEKDEVKLHSAFIGDLLNSQGMHGMKDIFLELFLQLLLKRSNQNFGFVELLNKFRTEGSIVKSEFHLPKAITKENTGGRIDLLVFDKSNNVLVIENKLFAPDQPQQLLRYKERFSKAPLYYLTLEGTDPGEGSRGNLKTEQDFICLSYKEDITEWLLKCIEKSAQRPKVRETIVQYFNLIKKMTNQTMWENQKNEVVEFITINGNNFCAAMNIAQALESGKLLLLKKMGIRLKELISVRLNLKIEIDENFGRKYCPLIVRLNKIEDVFLQLSFASNLSDIYLEIFNEKNEQGTKKDIKNVQFYRAELAEVACTWGKIENAEKSWWGDWVCRYGKMEDFLNTNNGWAKVADNDLFFLNEIANDMISILEVMQRNYHLNKIHQ